MHFLADALVDDLASPAPPTAPLALGAIGLYLAARFGTQALIGPKGFDGATAGRVAFGHWMPIVAVAVTAVLLGQSEMAVTLVFGSSVAALSLAIGIVTFFVPSEPAPITRRAWPFLLPAALLPLLAGFSGALNSLHAFMLALLGLLVWSVWRAAVANPTDGEAPSIIVPDATPPISVPIDRPAELAGAAAQRKTPRKWWLAFEWVLGVALAVIAARSILMGTLSVESTSHLYKGVLIAISPLLVLPLLSAGLDMAQRNRSGEASSACVGLALLNLLALVPVLIGIGVVRWLFAGGLQQTKPSARPWDFELAMSAMQQIPSISFPLTTWRIDCVVLTVLGFLLLPAATGRWRLGRTEAFVLMIAYVAYLATSAYLARRY